MNETRIPLVFPAGSREELDRIWKRWQLLPAEEKRISDEKSIEIFGMDNSSHYDILGLLYV
jgi:hypothetical protein